MAVLEVENIQKRYESVVAIDGLSFSVDRGEIVSLLGPSGCGKTTTLRLIAGFESLDAGCIRISGVDMERKRPYERNVGLLFQNYALFPHMTVFENIAFGLKHRGWEKSRISSRVGEMLELVKLSDAVKRFPAQLSGGQQQRIALARALATEPEVVLLDEPLSALDAKLRYELRIELKEILRSVGSTTIIVTHDQEEALGMAERVIVLNHGRLQQQGAPEVVYASPANRFVAEFVGRTNWLAGTLDECRDAYWFINCDSGLSLAIQAQDNTPANGFDIGIRPESIEIGTSMSTNGDGLTSLAGTVIDIASLGPERQVLVRLDSGEHVLAIDKRRKDRLELSQPIWLSIHAEDCIVLPR